MKLTKTEIAKIIFPAGKKEFIVWDEDMPGFGLRMRVSEPLPEPTPVADIEGITQRWICQYRVGSQQRRPTLGDPRKVPREAAHKIAREHFARVELGEDPVAEKEKAEAEAGQTLGKASDRYMEVKKDARPTTFRAIKHNLQVQFEPLRNRPLNRIKRADVADRLEYIAKNSGRQAAKNARGTLSALYVWAMQAGLCEINPVIGTRNPGKAIPSRERVLSDDEIRIIWNALLDDDFGRIVKLLILTGCRRSEIAELERSEVIGNVLRISPKRTKNKRELVLGLPPLTYSILTSAPQRREDARWFFPRLARNGAEIPYGPAFIWDNRALNERIERAIGRRLPHYVLHDTRRTCRTGMSRIGIQPHIAELVLNHVQGGIQAVYDKHRYQNEINAALARWADHVQAVAEGRDSNVVPLPLRA
jgi:integrase